MIVASNGKVVMAWEQGGDQWGNDYVGGAWGGRDLLSSESGYPTNLVAGTDGSVTAVWRSTDIKSSRFTGSGTGAATLDNSAETLIVGNDLAIDATGRIMAVWIQGTGASQHVWHAHFTPPSTWSTAAPLENNGGQANGPGVAYGTGGLAIATWRQASGANTGAWFNLYEPDDGWGTPGLIDPDFVGTTTESGEIFFDPGTGLRLTQNAGATSHRGIEVGVGVAPLPAVRLDASLAYARHRYERWQARGGVDPVDYSGNEMELAPRFFGTARLTLRPDFVPDGTFAVEVVRLGSYFMDPDNAHEYDGHTLMNVQANVPVYAGLDIVARLSNVTGERYAETSSFNAQQGERFRPGAPRQVFVGAQYRFSR